MFYASLSLAHYDKALKSTIACYDKKLKSTNALNLERSMNTMSTVINTLNEVSYRTENISINRRKMKDRM
jgi:hypothetical protein